MSKVSTMFLSALSVVDHAYVTALGEVLGGSFLPGFLVSGKVSEVEQVVVDFSTIKKEMKQIIDSQEFGFDHKLWILNGFSKIDQVPDYKSNRLALRSKAVEMDLPLDAVRIVTAETYDTARIGKVFELYLTAELRKRYPSITVKCFNTVDAHALQPPIPRTGFFRYTHGLKNSTSLGCQNIAHGHLSFVQLHNPKCSLAEDLNICSEIAARLDRAVFIWSENVYEKSDQAVAIKYSTEARGPFFARYSVAENNLFILEEETTIENLIRFAAKHFYRLLKGKAQGLFLSEGLSKGAYLEL